jgi:cytochrome c-type biogenesis protein CcmH/NrfG
MPCHKQNSLRAKGDLSEATAALREAIRLKPDFVAGVHHNLGLVLFAQEKLGDAISAYREAIRLRR